MASALVTAALSAGCASAGSLGTGLVLKASERRRALRDAGRLEVERRRVVQGYEATRELVHHVAELNHCVYHVEGAASRDELETYADSGRRHRLAIRCLVRAHAEMFGSELVAVVVGATDALEQFFDAAWNDAPRDVVLSQMRLWEDGASTIVLGAQEAQAALLGAGAS
jgi:hypothetical protein